MSTKKVIILSTHRSGSTWLLDMLRQHSRIQMYGEIFLDRPVKQNPLNPDLLPPIRFYEFNNGAISLSKSLNICSYLNKVDKWATPGNYVGYKVMYNHLKVHKFLLPLIIYKRYRVIHLVRENLFDTVISHYFLQNTGVSNIFKGKEHEGQKAIYIPPQDLLKRLDKQKKEIDFYRKKLKSLPMASIEVDYESLRADTKASMEKIMYFLGLNVEDSFENTRYTKLNQKQHHERLENYQEIYNALKGTYFFKFIQ